MNEVPTILKARQFLRDARIDSAPVDIERLAAAANAKIKVVYDLADDESGQTTQIRGKHVIIVNGNHREERQRFTVVHEIAHIVLKLPSQHHQTTLKTDLLFRYRRRPEEEVLCDVFAAECLLPYHPFAEQVADTDICLDAVKSLAEEYKASLTTTGSRFALNAREPCAFVLSEAGSIRYVSRSKYLKELRGWIEFNRPVPSGSVSHRLINGNRNTEDYDEIPTDTWFDGGIRNRPLVAEEAVLLPLWDQCLCLIWFDESAKPPRERLDRDEYDDPLLQELDGTLPWPSKRRRK
ncbi:MAG: ImmA/IrrE family metallo-endopeptidase [Rhodospirillaceae bacterium]|nr:ImmA/IrrE family metallo-endopeptidase [Rhodospirillaceae bacterium]MDD9998055.1 ImmA/IrrE family metallo-endopeptidase [Rhodospirillaceae bacterium]MDE0359838.1 ImmA/IrrE family metallo-endopeptidase [Rhodospirillaceae bacterium]